MLSKHNDFSSGTIRIQRRGGSRAAATSKMERFVIIVNGFQPLTIITKRSILDVAAALDPPLFTLNYQFFVLDTGMYPPIHHFDVINTWHILIVQTQWQLLLILLF